MSSVVNNFLPQRTQRFTEEYEKSSMKNFLINLSVISAIAGTAAYLASKNFSQIDFSLATYLCIYFFILTAVSHYSITGSVSSDNNQPQANNKFVSRYLLVTVAKFLFSLLILLGYVFFNQESAVPFIILFAGYYFLFTAFEIVSLMQFFRTKKQ